MHHLSVVNGNGLKLNISEDDNSQDLSLAIEVAEYCRVKPENVTKIIEEVIDGKELAKRSKSLGLVC